MAKKRGNIESIIEEKLLTSLIKREIDFDDIHRKVYLFSKKYKLDPNDVGKVLWRIVGEIFKNQDFSMNPPRPHHHHGHGGH